MLAPSKKISLSISVVLYNNDKDELDLFAGSLSRAIKKLKTEIPTIELSLYLIDNTEDPDTGLKVNVEKSLGVPTKHLSGHGNIGYGRAHNLAITDTNMMYHLIMNPDVSLHEDCLELGVKSMTEHSDVVITGPFGSDYNNRPAFLAKKYPSIYTLLLRGFSPAKHKGAAKKRLDDYEMHELPLDRLSFDIPILSGCFMFCKTQALKKINGFDPGFFLYFEDFDLSLRIQSIGKSCFNPAMRIKHGGGHAAKKGRRHIYFFTKSMIRFFNKHGWKLF